MIRKKTGLVEGYIATLEICAKTSANTILNISKNYVLIQSPQNGKPHSNNSSPNCRWIVSVCLTILWVWRLKG